MTSSYIIQSAFCMSPAHSLSRNRYPSRPRRNVQGMLRIIERVAPVVAQDNVDGRIWCPWHHKVWHPMTHKIKVLDEHVTCDFES